jgi:hypothetical protein
MFERVKNIGRLFTFFIISVVIILSVLNRAQREKQCTFLILYHRGAIFRGVFRTEGFLCDLDLDIPS